MGGGVCGCCISVVVMLLIFEVVDATAMPLCHVSNFQDKAGKLQTRVVMTAFTMLMMMLMPIM